MRLISVEELSQVWPHVEPWIAAAVAHNPVYEGTLDVLVALARGVYSLWLAPSFCAVTQVSRFPRCTALTLIYVGGSDLSAIENALEFAKLHCRRNDISVIRFFGRPGWERVLGVKPAGALLQIEVT